MALNNIRDLILLSYRDAVILGNDEILSGPQEEEGLDRLNLKIQNLYSRGINIPFYSEVNFNLVPLQSDYVISELIGADVTAPPFIELNFVNIYYGNVWLPIEIVPVSNYYNLPRVQQSSSLPAKVTIVYQNEECILKFYYPPTNNYPCKAIGKSGNPTLALTDSIKVMPKTFQRFLEFALAIELNAVYHLEDMPDYIMEEYKEMYESLKSEVQRDTSSYPNPFFRKGPWTQDIRAGGYDV